MAWNVNVDGTTSAGADGAVGPPLGARVWLLRDGRVGRVVAMAQGGLLCRVLMEDDLTLLLRPGCELLRLSSAGAT